MKLTKGLIKADIISAKQAIEYFDRNQNKEIKNIAAYHLQQAAEKLIKIQIYQNMDDIDNRKMYTHDLSKLIGYAESLYIDIKIPQYVYNHMNTITDWEIGSRYDVGFSVRIDTIKKCYDAVIEWYEQV